MTNRQAKNLNSSKFNYVTYIRTTPEQLWDALIKPEFTKQYWFGSHHESDWKQGSSWKLITPDGRNCDSGEVLEVKRPQRLVLKWRHELAPELKAEGYSQATMELEPIDETVKLTVTHEMESANSKFIAGCSNGWPIILSSLKSYLETGQSHKQSRKMPN